MSEKRRKRHSPEQIVRKLRDADAMLNAGKDVAAVLQTLEVIPTLASVALGLDQPFLDLLRAGLVGRRRLALAGLDRGDHLLLGVLDSGHATGVDRGQRGQHVGELAVQRLGRAGDLAGQGAQCRQGDLQAGGRNRGTFRRRHLLAGPPVGPDPVFAVLGRAATPVNRQNAPARAVLAPVLPGLARPFRILRHATILSFLFYKKQNYFEFCKTKTI